MKTKLEEKYLYIFGRNNKVKESSKIPPILNLLLAELIIRFRTFHSV